MTSADAQTDPLLGIGHWAFPRPNADYTLYMRGLSRAGRRGRAERNLSLLTPGNSLFDGKYSLFYGKIQGSFSYSGRSGPSNAANGVISLVYF